MRKRRKGFISTRAVVAIYIVLLLLPLAYSAFAYIGNNKFNYNEVSNEIAMADLRRILMLSYDLENNGDYLSFIYKGDNYELYQTNNKLILKPGTQIILNDIDSIEFINKNGCIYLIYETKGKTYERNICKASGIHLADFSFDDDDTDGSSDNDSQ